MDYVYEDSPSSSQGGDIGTPMEVDQSVFNSDGDYHRNIEMNDDYRIQTSPSDGGHSSPVNEKTNGFGEFVPNGSAMEEVEEDGSQISREFSPLQPRFSDLEDEEEAEESVEEVKQEEEKEVVEGFMPPSLRDDAPLAGIIYPELEDIDPRKFFPEFRPNKVLRFSRIFAAAAKGNRQAHLYITSNSFDSAPDAKVKEEEKPFELEIASPPKPEKIYNEALHFDEESGSEDEEAGNDEEPAPWRYGPAQFFYDRMDLPPNPKNFDYGLKAARKQKSFRKAAAVGGRSAPSTSGEDKGLELPTVSEDNFLAVNLIRWEDSVYMDANAAKDAFIKDYCSGKIPYSGYIPIKGARTYKAFVATWKKNNAAEWISKDGLKDETSDKFPNAGDYNNTQVVFPADNVDIERCDWEKDIIWDLDDIKTPLVPKLMTLEVEDDPRLNGIPDDIRLEDFDGDESKSTERKDNQFTKKSKLILSQVQMRQKQEEQEQLESTMAQMADRDAFHFSNDDTYLPKTNKCQAVVFSGGSVIQHSIPAQNIDRAFFPTYLPAARLRHFHRTPMNKRILRGLQIDRDGFVEVFSLNKHIQEIAQCRNLRSMSDAGFEVFPVREISDLSAKDGNLILLEYSEEHPPLLSQPGMASKIRNYYKRKNNKDPDLELEYGETVYSHTFPFLGTLAPGSYLQAIENNMFRAAIYKHVPRTTDYLLIKSGHRLLLRKCPVPFVVGQECPLQEVPNPNSKKASVFIRDFLLAFIYRLFWASTDNPRRLKMEDIKAAFPHYAESSVRKRLKGCSNFRRLGTGTEQNYWVLRDDFRLPSKEEVLNMITPEMCCANYSMLAAEQRLKDAGYGEKYIFAGEDENDSNDEVSIEDEIKCAPWNTTRAFLAAQREKCILDQTGIADPTGCGAGYSYVRVSAKPQKEDVAQVPKRLVTGTNADLRKLPLKEAKEICKQYGVKDDEIRELSRWEIIDVIRTLSTKAAKARSDFAGMARFARGNIRFNYADMKQKYKEYCQRIFDLQNKTLSNEDDLSTDNDSSDEEDEDNAEMVNRLENIVCNVLGKKPLPSSNNKKIQNKKKKPAETSEEQDLEDLRRMVHGDKEDTQQSTASTGNISANDSQLLKPLLNLPPGVEEAEVASNLKISRSTLEQLVSRDNKPKKLKIIREIREPDGRIAVRSEIISNTQVVEAYVRVRTTKDEKFIRDYSHKDEEYKEEKRKEKRRLQDQLRRIKRNEERQKQGLAPKKQTAPPKPKPLKESLQKMKCSACGGTGHMKTNKNCPLYGKQPPTTSTIKTIGDILGAHKNEQQNLQGELTEVDGTKLKIKRRALGGNNASLKLAIPREALKSAPSLPEEDTRSTMTVDSDIHTDDDDKKPSLKMKFSQGKLGVQKRRSTVEEVEYWSGPSKTTQRRRADPKVSMATLLSEIYSELKTVPGSDALMYPVNLKLVPDYLKYVERPMDMQQIFKKITKNHYTLRKEFLADVNQMVLNSMKYNGATHPITIAAGHMFKVASDRIHENEAKFFELEKAINPLLHEDDMVGFCYILEEIVEACKHVPKSTAFHTKVDPKKCPYYHEKIKKPMHLGLIHQKIKEHQYLTVGQFRKDIQLIYENSLAYNGPNSLYTNKAAELLQAADQKIIERGSQLMELENNIRRKKREEGIAVIEEEDYSLSAILNKYSSFDSQDQPPVISPMEPIELDSQSIAGESDRPMASSVVFGDDEDTRAGFDDDSGGVLNDDLALSDEDEDEPMQQIIPDSSDMTSDDEMTRDNIGSLKNSNMGQAGQLSNDLALSSSSDEESEIISAKRLRLDNNDLHNF